jgi:S-adenosylmethionine synthetase
VGKIYNVLTYQMASHIIKEVPGVREVYVWLLSRIGEPINQPDIASAQLILEPGVKMKDISGPTREMIEAELDNIDKFCMDLALGKIPVC